MAARAGGLAHANPQALGKLPAPVHTAYITAFTNALGTVFVVAAGVAAFAFLLSWILPERPLRESVTAGSGIGESFAVPKHTDSQAEIARALSVLVGRERRRQMVERLAERAGVDLSPGAAWLLVRLHDDPAADIAAAVRAVRRPRGGCGRARSASSRTSTWSIGDAARTRRPPQARRRPRS